MTTVLRGILAVAALAAVAACNRPNLESTGGGYPPDASGAPASAPASSTPPAGTATPR